MKYENELRLAIDISKKASELLKGDQYKVNSSLGHDIELEADKVLDDFIIRELSALSQIPILSEENGETGTILSGEPLWIVDPLDGSMNYSRKVPMYCISIGLWEGSVPVFGVIYDPSRDELIYNDIQGNLYLNDSIVERKEFPTQSNSILSTGFPVSFNYENDDSFVQLMENARNFKKIRMIGSAALSLAWTALGRFDAYSEDNIKLWDVAAGIAINKSIEKSRVSILKNLDVEWAYKVDVFNFTQN